MHRIFSKFQYSKSVFTQRFTQYVTMRLQIITFFRFGEINADAEEHTHETNSIELK